MNNTANKLTTKKLNTGEFDVYWNGEKTGWTISNGSNGTTGNGMNVYYVISPKGSMTPVGTLQNAKVRLTLTLSKG